MHFKWDSSVARDIEIEMDRLREELGDCSAEIDRCTAILGEMQGGELNEVIAKYVSAAGKLKKGLLRLEETFQKTGRGIARANEMFENNELRLRHRADSMGSEVPASDSGWVLNGTITPVFYNIPGTVEYSPIMVEATSPVAQWPILQEVKRAVVIDQVSIGNGVVMPPWLESVIDTE